MANHNERWSGFERVGHAVLLGVVLAGCRGASLEGKTACEEQRDCLAGYACIDDECVATSEGCDAFCENACSALESCDIDPGPSCADQCVVDLGAFDCASVEPFDRLPCSRLEHAVECVGYCQAVCERGAECASIDVELCSKGCLDDLPLVCNPASVPARSCELIKAETRLYDLDGRALAEGSSPGGHSHSLETIGLCTAAYDCDAPLGCSLETNTCGECRSDADCDATGSMACTAEGCTRVECVSDDNCLSDVCDVATHTCLDCREDADCTSGACDVENHECVACKTDAQCDPALLPACDTELMTCVPCLTDEHCAHGVLGGVLLACDAATRQCVECTEDRHCTDPMEPACNTESHFCERCVTNEHCADPLAARCENNSCSRCASDDDCAHLDGAPFCNLEYGICGECKGPEQCTDPDRPMCQSVDARCVP